MSDFELPSRPVLSAGADDPSRAPPVSAGEFDRITREMDAILPTLLQNAAGRLKASGFSTVNSACRGGAASILVQCPATEVEAWLRFQVNRTFAMLTSAECVFWTYATFKAGRFAGGNHGQLTDFTQIEAQSGVISDFIHDCLEET